MSKILKRKRKPSSGVPAASSDLTSGSTSQHEHAGYGIEAVYEPGNPSRGTVDIVFVHGLTGDRHNTWTHKDSGTFWPEDLLAKDISDARLFTFGYDADIVKIWGQSSQNMIGAHAANLNGDLVRRRERSDPVSKLSTFCLPKD